MIHIVYINLIFFKCIIYVYILFIIIINILYIKKDQMRLKSYLKNYIEIFTIYFISIMIIIVYSNIK